MKRELSFALILLMLLSLEKFVQHMVVTYAFATDMGSIREQMSLDYRIFMIAGFIVGILFLDSFILMLRRNRIGLDLLLGLALFDFFGEFIGQGTLLISIPVSFIAATLIIFVLLLSRKSLILENKPSESTVT